MSVLPRPVAFWLVGATLLALMFAGGAPSMLYSLYQERFGFSDATRTTVFAVYAVALLLALITVGGLSDHVGRRPVLAVALLVEVASMVMFATAGGVAALIAARIVQGLATGAATGALSAALIDLQPPANDRIGPLMNNVATTGGVALGVLGTGLLVQYAPAPAVLVFVLLAAVFVAGGGGILLMPETSVRRPGALAALRPQVAVPRRIRREFLLATPALVAVWALGGLYLALGTSLTAQVLGIEGRLAGGFGIVLLAATGCVTSVLMRERAPRPAQLGGCAVLAAGLGVSVLGLLLPSAPVYFGGVALAGLGFGAAFFGAFRTLALLAAPAERAAVMAMIYVVSYLAFSLPTIAAGLLSTAYGLLPTAVGYASVLIVLCLTVVVGLLTPIGRSTPTPPSSVNTEAARAHR